MADCYIVEDEPSSSLPVYEVTAETMTGEQICIRLHAKNDEEAKQKAYRKETLPKGGMVRAVHTVEHISD